MRILQFVADGAPGGGTTHVSQVVRALAGSHELALLTQRDSYLAAQSETAGVEVYGGNWFGAVCLPGALHSLRRAIHRFRPELVHCHGGRAAWFYSLLKSPPPMLYTVHGLHYARRRRAARVAGRWQHRRAIGCAAHVIFVCQYDRCLALNDQLLSPGKPHSVVYNGIDFPDSASIAAKRPAFDRSPCEQKPIGFVGRLVPQKNPELFIEALSQLPDQAARMIGGGVLADDVDRMIERRGLAQRVERLGELSREQTLAVLADLDVLVMTSRWEGLPLLPLEAMHLGVPVVATAVGGVTEIIDDGQTGLLAPESPQALAAAVRRLQTEPGLRDRIVEAAQRRVHAQFSEDTMIAEIDISYRSLAGQASKVLASEASV